MQMDRIGFIAAQHVPGLPKNSAVNNDRVAGDLSKVNLAYAACSVMLRFATNGGLDSVERATALRDVGEG